VRCYVPDGNRGNGTADGGNGSLSRTELGWLSQGLYQGEIARQCSASREVQTRTDVDRLTLKFRRYLRWRRWVIKPSDHSTSWASRAANSSWTTIVGSP
jgi:hypothetical protein